MARRVTIKDAESCFDNLLRITKKRKAQSFNDVGAWELDNNPIFGGVVVNEIVSETGGISNPLGSGRRSPREFCEFVQSLQELESRKVVQVSSSNRARSHRRRKPRTRTRRN